MTEERLQFRVHGDPQQPTLVYLPGLHGDWTLVGSFRKALADRLRFVETTYPRTLTWSLEDYAEAIEAGLAALDIRSGWLLGESFGSQVVWPMVQRARFRIDGVILAGGFVKHPLRWGVRLAECLTAGVSMTLLTRILLGYAWVARARYRKSPEVLNGIQEFMARRTELDRQAAKHRLRLVAESDARTIARNIRVPLYVISGLVDPIVPWVLVRGWMRRHCSALREYRLIFPADHNVLGTAPQAAADQVTKWMLSR